MFRDEAYRWRMMDTEILLRAVICAPGAASKRIAADKEI